MKSLVWLILVIAVTVRASNPGLFSKDQNFWASRRKMNSATAGFCRRLERCRNEKPSGEFSLKPNILDVVLSEVFRSFYAN